ncbi:hypothetical protein AB205_0210600 [Aquarana catesbeiana]|uniref:Carbonic anhydrase n=1 Tax=Aquarana catesbeiana TaxID=8400 RepID=A0A2G9P1E7_AQUCT|nr:hypothetical protein AB205_0210600 [Aquarana catesbeiana]
MGVCTSSTAQCLPRQSPIDIQTRRAKYDSSLKPLFIQYDPNTSKRIINVGHCFNVEFDDSSDRSVLSEGPLTSHYRLRQFHFHWGTSDRDGSEHVIDGQTYPAELHIVHWNSQRYSSFEEATKHSDGLAVIGVLLKIGEPNPVLQNIIDNLDKVKTKERTYWTYLGSLTTSPYSECVTWVLLQEAITISSEQLQHFRGLQNEDEEFILENHRPLQPIEKRLVKSSCKHKNHKP